MFDLRLSSTLFCRAGNTFINIEGWGSVTLMTKYKGYPNGRPLTLTNVALIPSFHCSLVLFKLLRTKGKMHWNNESELCILAVPQGIYCETLMHHNIWTVEYNPIDDTIATFSTENLSLFKAPSSFKAQSSYKLPPLLRLTGVQAPSNLSLATSH